MFIVSINKKSLQIRKNKDLIFIKPLQLNSFPCFKCLRINHIWTKCHFQKLRAVSLDFILHATLWMRYVTQLFAQLPRELRASKNISQQPILYKTFSLTFSYTNLEVNVWFYLVFFFYNKKCLGPIKHLRLRFYIFGSLNNYKWI